MWLLLKPPAVLLLQLVEEDSRVADMSAELAHVKPAANMQVGGSVGGWVGPSTCRLGRASSRVELAPARPPM